LTLLTNRLGDAVIIIVFCSFIRITKGDLLITGSTFMVISFMALTFTKRAQWPFVSWLPAAIAAPTPVRSLVHSSTLVTAGIWLIIRFRQPISFRVASFGILGIITLVVASLSALIETDAKKVVALSTLRQLGLMFIALALGSIMICYFHVLIHALAKANLFISIGGLLHNRFSQQDARLISSRALGPFIIFRIIISLFRLIGLTFIAGFFSKEQILMRQPYLLNRLRSFVLITFIARLTLSYCLKLFLSISYLNSERVLQFSINRITQFFPIFFIRIIRIIGGLLIRINITPCFFIIGRIETILWAVRILGLAYLALRDFLLILFFKGFYIQGNIIRLLLRRLNKIKKTVVNLESSGRERIFLLRSYLLIKILKQSVRLVLFFSILISLFIIL